MKKSINKIILASCLVLTLLFFSNTGVFAQTTAEASTITAIQQAASQDLSYLYANYGTDPTTVMPWLDDYCNKSGMDFIIEIPLDSCSPSVVRSDLLEEQNVQVLCKLTGVKINPLIDVTRIKDISPVETNRSQDILGVSYYPPRAALSYANYQQGQQVQTTSQGKILGVAEMSNMGYVVVSLKQQASEGKMPSSVKTDMTLKITYDTSRTYGTEENQLMLPLLTDDEWNSRYKEFSFWKGKGYVRLLNLTENKARIAIYTNPKASPIRIVDLIEGETSSNEINLPGFYCSAGVKPKLEKISLPTNRATIYVDGVEQIVEQGDSLGNSGCSVSGIFPSEYGYGGEVRVFCTGNPEIALTLSDLQAQLNIGTDPAIKVSPGEEITVQLTGSNNVATKEKWYVGYIGREYLQAKSTSGQYAQGIDEVIILYNWTGKHEDPDKANLKRINNVIYNYMDGLHKQGDYSIDSNEIIKELKNKISGMDKILKSDDLKVIYKSKTSSFENINGKSVKLTNVTGPIQPSYSADIEKEYLNTINYYKEISNKYTALDSKEGTKYGILALREAATFADKFLKRQDAIEILNLIETKYSSSTDSDILAELEDAKKEILTNLQITGDNRKTVITSSGEHSFELQKFYKSGINDLSVTLRVDDVSGVYTIGDKMGSESLWEIKDIQDKAVVLVNVSDMKSMQTVSKDQGYVALPQSTDSPTKVTFVSSKITKEVKLTILPFDKERTTYANFTLQIGIEKRAITLSPDKAKSLVSKLNDTINKIDSVNNKIAALTTTWKKACLVGATSLWAKNFVQSVTGTGYARKLAMQSWLTKCSDAAYRHNISATQEISVDRCYQLKQDEINADVEIMETALKNTNSFIESIKSGKAVLKKSGLFNSISTINEEEFFVAAQTRLQSSDLNSLIFRGKDADEKDDAVSVSAFTNQLTLYQKDGLITSTNFKDYILEFYLKTDCTKKNPKESTLCNTERDQANYAKLKDLIKREESSGASRNSQKNSLNNGLNLRYVPVYSEKNQLEIKAQTAQLSITSATQYGLPNPILYNGKDATIAVYTNQRGETNSYLLILENQGFSDANQKRFNVKEIYKLVSDGKTISSQENLKGKEGSPPFNIVISYDVSKCRSNTMSAQDNKVKFWESGTYSGLVSYMPIDRTSGYYFATKGPSVFETTNSAWKSNGDIQTYYICNVGMDKTASWTADGPQGDDLQCCIEISSQVNMNDIVLPGFEYDADGKQQSAKIIGKAKTCSKQAITARLNGNTKISTDCGTFEIGKPFASGTGTSCEEFMSPSDCKLLYNLCDPVMCPKTRCDYGGRYPVENVIQSGIIGSLVLCSQNFDGGKGVIMPVCLTGLNAGLDSLNSVLKSSRDCLQEQLANGKTVGICDYIQSVYLCELMWKELDPLLKSGLPTIIQSTTNKGGGEYALFSESWNSALNSARYFTDYYGLESFKSFKARSVAQSGTEVCKKFVSVAYPTQAKFFNEFAQVDSPPQAFATFEEISLGDAAPQSHYKVFYHIYAGKDSGVFYSVYLKSPSSQTYYSVPETYIVKDAYGFLNAGETISQTPDFTAPSGYKQVCIKLNDQEICGFTQATTDFAINEVKNYYLESQLRSNVTKASECISGTASLIPTATLNLEQAAESMVNPELYKSGIIRVCSSTNPGGTDTTRWTKVGYCDNEQISCWLDGNSVETAITDTKIASDIITEKQAQQLASIIATEGYDNITDTKTKLDTQKTSYEILKTSINDATKRYNSKMKVWYDGYKTNNNNQNPSQDYIDENSTLIENNLGFSDLKTSLTNLESTYIDIKLKAFQPIDRAEADMYIARIMSLHALLTSQEELFIAEVVVYTELSAVQQTYGEFKNLNFWPIESNNIDTAYSQKTPYLKIDSTKKYELLSSNGKTTGANPQEVKNFEVYPIASGNVISAGYDTYFSKEGKPRYFIILDHQNGFYSYYGNLVGLYTNTQQGQKEVSSIAVGQSFTTEEKIGTLKDSLLKEDYFYLKIFNSGKDFNDVNNAKNPLCFFSSSILFKLTGGSAPFFVKTNEQERITKINEFLASTECVTATGGSTTSTGTTQLSTGLSKFLTTYYDKIKTESTKNSIDPTWLAALLYHESSGVSTAISSTGCVGLGQFCYNTAINYPDTFQKLTKCNCGPDSNNVCPKDAQCNVKNDDRFNPDKSIEAAAKYYGSSVKGYSNYTDKYRFAVATYNAGKSVIDAAIKSTDKSNPSWEEIFQKITPESMKKFSPYNSWNDTRLTTKINNEIKVEVSSVSTYQTQIQGNQQPIQANTEKNCFEYIDEQSCNGASEGTTKCIWAKPANEISSKCGKCPANYNGLLVRTGACNNNLEFQGANLQNILSVGFIGDGNDRPFTQSECGVGKISNDVCNLNCIYLDDKCTTITSTSIINLFSNFNSKIENDPTQVASGLKYNDIFLSSQLSKLANTLTDAQKNNVKIKANELQTEILQIEEKSNTFDFNKQDANYLSFLKYKEGIQKTLTVLQQPISLTSDEIAAFENYYHTKAPELIAEDFITPGRKYDCADFAIALLGDVVQNYNTEKKTNYLLDFSVESKEYLWNPTDKWQDTACAINLATSACANLGAINLANDKNTISVSEAQMQAGDFILYQPIETYDHWHSVIISELTRIVTSTPNDYRFRLAAGTTNEGVAQLIHYYNSGNFARAPADTVYTAWIGQQKETQYGRPMYGGTPRTWNFANLLRK